MVEMMAGGDAALQLPAQESTSSHNLKYRRGEGINILLYIIIFIHYHYILLYIIFNILLAQESTCSHNLKNRRGSAGINIFYTQSI